MSIIQERSFRLTDSFLNQYKNVQPDWGFNEMGYFIYMRTYSRIKNDGTNERWWETVKRVVEGTYSIQKKWMLGNRLPWSTEKAQRSAQEMYSRMFDMKFLPPGRGLWAMGTAITEERQLFAALNNCSFISTHDIKIKMEEPFVFLMDASMVGVGVGFDVKGAGKIDVKSLNGKLQRFIIPDTREGWVKSVGILIRSFLIGGDKWEFDYSKIRPAGMPIKGFGGVSSGYRPLKELHDNIRTTMIKNIGNPITMRTIADIMNMIGKAVIAGNVRRTAEIIFGDPYDAEYLDLKDYEKNPERADYGWTSNNSIFADLGMDYKNAAERTAKNGEPGYAWLENMRGYSRMGNNKDWKDRRVMGGNPCLEQSLESGEMCTLVETFPTRHTSKSDYLRTLKFAYLYGKTVTLAQTHWPDANRVMMRNRRIGCSVSGIAQFITKYGIHELKNWLEEGYKVIHDWDSVYSDWLGVPRSIKTTSVKPSGTVSLLAGTTPGVHYPQSRFYIRRVRIAENSPLIRPMKLAGYHVENAINNNDTCIISFPIDTGTGIRTLANVSMWEQLSLAAFMQRYWADNQVSCTVTFNEYEKNQIKNALNYYQYQLKGISFLPKLEKGVFPQMPYEEIDETEYLKMVKRIRHIDFTSITNNSAIGEKFCSNDTCEI